MVVFELFSKIAYIIFVERDLEFKYQVGWNIIWWYANLWKLCRKESSECYAWVPTTKMKLPNDGKWKGEGIGYEPDVFSYTENMKETLENLGVDTSDIFFK